MKKSAYWVFLCDCGREVRARGSSVARGHTVGCKKKCKSQVVRGRENNSLPESTVWGAMKRRCYNKNSPEYKYYGARGITVCERWRKSFSDFYADMGPRPSPKHSIDRIDVNGNYEPSNCRWATQLIQSRNTRVFATNSSGVNGVKYRPKNNKRWVARIRHNGKDKFLGIFMTKEEAIAARKEAEQKYWGDNNDKAVNN
jgi:hypothetical protein